MFFSLWLSSARCPAHLNLGRYTPYSVVHFRKHNISLILIYNTLFHFFSLPYLREKVYLKHSTFFLLLLLPYYNLMGQQDNLRNDFLKYEEASDSKRYGDAFDLLYFFLEKYSATFDKDQVLLIKGMLISEAFRGINAAVTNQNSIPNLWLKRISKIEPPSESQADRFFDYALIQYHLAAHFALNESKFDLARVYFIEAESYFEEARGEQKDMILTDPDLKNWMRNLRSTIGQEISSQGLHVGTYVTNKGSTQKWIGKVIERSGSILRIRITFSTSDSSYEETKSYEMVTSEIKLLNKVSLNALLHGYR